MQSFTPSPPLLSRQKLSIFHLKNLFCRNWTKKCNSGRFFYFIQRTKIVWKFCIFWKFDIRNNKWLNSKLNIKSMNIHKHQMFHLPLHQVLLWKSELALLFGLLQLPWIKWVGLKGYQLYMWHNSRHLLRCD